MDSSVSPPRLSTSLVLLLVVALLPLFGLVTYTSLQNKQDSLTHTHDHLLGTARLTALRYEGTVEGARQLLGAIASAPAVKNQDLSVCTGYLKALHGKYPFYANLGLLDLNGNLVCHAVNITGTRFLGDRFYFKQVLATQSFAIGEYIIGRTHRRPALTFGMPVVDDKGELSGVAFAALELEKLASDQQSILPSAVRVIVTDRNGILVGGDTSLSNRIGSHVFDAALFAAVKALPSQTFEAVDQQGKTSIYAAVSVGNSARPGLFVTASIPKEAVLKPAKDQFVLALALLSLFAAVGAVGARWVAKRTIVEPTRRLLKQVNTLAGGDGAAPPDGPAGHQNELVELTHAFNRMAVIVQAREAERDKAERLLTTRLRQQEAISQLSIEAARASAPASVLQSAMRCVADALRADLCNVLQLTTDERHLLFVAGVGWKAGLVGTAMVAMDALSQAGYTLRAGQPVLVEDFRTESRFGASALRAEHGIVSSISVTIEVQGKPWGLLSVHSRSERNFTPEDTHFMQSAANLITLAIERMAVQADLAQHSRSMNEAQRIAHLGSWEFDFASQAVKWSDEVFRICGVKATRFTDSFDEYLNMVHPDDRARVQAEAAPMSLRLAPLPSKHRLVRPDGSVRHVHARGDLRLGDQGQAVAVCGTVFDVTELQAAQVRAEEMAELLSEAQHIADMGSWELDAATGQMHWPVQTCRLFGIEAKDFGGTLKAALQFVLPEHRQLILNIHQSRVPASSLHELEFRIRRGDGEVRWIRMQGVLKCDAHGHELRWLGMVMDITERRQARVEILALNTHLEERVRQRTAQLEAANHELEAFSYSVSHDLRSPLKTIEGFSHLLERAVGGEADKKAKHYLSRIRAGTRQMADLIDGLLSLAQLSRDTLQLSSVDLSAIARRVEHECREREPARQAQVHIQDAMLVKGDARLLLAVIQNLLGNAWKFTAKQEEARIEIGSTAGAVDEVVDAMGETVYFVKDNGAGFDMAHADKLFGTFERLHSPSDFSGTGIGLATVKRIIERHAGRVWAEGLENKGATFYFTLGRAVEPGA